MQSWAFSKRRCFSSPTLASLRLASD